MKKTTIFLSIFFIVACKVKKTKEIQQELIESKEYHDIIFGKKIADPYRFMENDKDTRILKWYKEQSLYTDAVLAKINNREKLIGKLKKIEGKNKGDKLFKVKVTKNDQYFYLKDTKEGIAKRLFYKKGIKEKEELLCSLEDIQKLGIEGNIINYFQPSPNGTKVVLSTTKEGKELSNMIILDVSSKKKLPQIIGNCSPSSLGGVNWLPNDTGFFYMHVFNADRNAKDFLLDTSCVLYKLGEDPLKLKTIISKKNNPSLAIKREDFPIAHMVGKDFLFAGIFTVRDFVDYYYAPISELSKEKITWKPLYKKEDKVKSFYVAKNDVYLLSAKNASNFRILKGNINKVCKGRLEVIIPEDSLEVITTMKITKNGLFFVKNKNGVIARVYHKDLKRNGEVTKIKMPLSGDISLKSNGVDSENLWMIAQGWTKNKQRYKYDAKTTQFIKENIIASEDHNGVMKNFVIKEIEVPSHDGMLVPLSIIHKEGIKLDAQNRVLLTGYGAYGYSKKPKVSDGLKLWLEEGGVYAIAHVRGGGEKGAAWYEGGYKQTKPNTWKGFIACAEYLIKENYTSAGKMFAKAGSAGGILLGRAITERPELFKAVSIRAGMLNAIRTEFGPSGLNNIAEFGSVKDSLGFISLLEMDAYQHIKKEVNYPAMLLISGLNDPRGSAWETGKFAAKMLQANSSESPVLLSVDFKGGHGFDMTKDKKYKYNTDVFSFALWQTGHPDYQLK